MRPLAMSPYAVVSESLPAETYNHELERMELEPSRSLPRPVVEITGHWLGGQPRCLLQEISWFGRRLPGTYYWPECNVLDRFFEPLQRERAIVQPIQEIAEHHQRVARMAVGAAGR